MLEYTPLLSNLNKPEEELPHIPLFVYGTLRVGGSLHHLIQPYIIQSIDNLYVQGKLYSSTQGPWSLLVKSDQSRVVGTLYALKKDAQLIKNIFREEILFGYDLTWENIYRRSDEKLITKALVSTWNSDQFLDKFIPSGDWLQYLYSN